MVRAHGNRFDLNKELRFKKLLGEKTFKNQISYALNYVDLSSLCFGLQDEAGYVFSMLTHVASVACLTDVESKWVFAHNCLVLSGAEVNRKFYSNAFLYFGPVPHNIVPYNMHTGGPMVFVLHCKVGVIELL